jgi:hypothetical protein
MTQAKAIINLQTGTIELEGPVEFVRAYLERYAPLMSDQQAPDSRKPRAITPRGKVAKDKGVKKRIVKGKPARQKKIKPVKILTRGKRGQNSCARIINNEIDAGFFDKPVSITAVSDRMREAGFSCSKAMLRGSLKKAIAQGTIESTGKGRGMVYMKKETGNEAP